MTEPIVPDGSDGKKTGTDTPPGKGKVDPEPATPPAATTPAPSGSAGDGTRTFSQEEVNELLGKTRQEGRDRAVAGLLSDLKLDDVDALKTIVVDAEAHRKAQMTELDQAKEEANRLKLFEDQATDQAKAIKKYEKAVDATVSSLMETLEVPDHVKPLLEAMPTLARLAYLTEHGEVFKKESSKPPETNVSGKGAGKNGADASARKKKTRQKYGIR